jgi:hypothetical protein
MAGLDPRLSGLAEVPLDCQLSWISRQRRLGVDEAIEAAAVHQVEAHEAGEGERAGDRLLPGLSQTQQQEGDQGDGDLDAHGVFASAEEAPDFEDLLDPAEEQLDRPAPLVEIGDFLGRGVKVVRQDAQYLAAIELDLDLAHRIAKGVFAPAALACRQIADPVRQDRPVRRHRHLFDDLQGGIGFEAGDDAAALGIELGPPAIVIIAQIKDIEPAPAKAGVAPGSIGIACAAVMSLTRAAVTAAYTGWSASAS